MAADELTKALLLEEVSAPRAIAEALFASVTGSAPLLHALVDSGAATPELLSRYLARTEVPFLRQVIPQDDLVMQLPVGLCHRLLAVPVRRDPATGTVDVAVADPGDIHPGEEIAFHLASPVRLVRSSLASIDEALRRIRMGHASPADRFREAARAAAHDVPDPRKLSLPPPAPELSFSMPSEMDVAPRRGGLVVEPDSNLPPAAQPPQSMRIRTPPWGTPVHKIAPAVSTESPPSGYGSEIPIPLTRKTYYPGANTATKGTQRPPAPELFRHSAPIQAPPQITVAPERPLGSFIPGPPPLPEKIGAFTSPTTPQMPFPEMGGILAALRNANARDEVLELVLMGARMVAVKVALFVVKKGGYLGWMCTPEVTDRTTLQSVLIPLDANSIFDDAVREDLYLGPIRPDDANAPLQRILKNPTRDVAAVPIKVSGKTAVLILADELGDTMIGTRRLEELARAAGEAFARIVRTKAR